MTEIKFTTLVVLDSCSIPDEFEDELAEWATLHGASNNSIYSYALKDNSQLSKWLKDGGVKDSHIKIFLNW